MLTLILIAVTVLVSWLAFDRPRLLDRLILWPPAIDRNKQYDRLLFAPKSAIPVDFEGDNRLFVIPVEDVVAVFRKEN